MARKRQPRRPDIPLFDPGRVPEPEDAPTAPEADRGTRSRPLTVGRLAREVHDALDSRFPDVWVVGQISGFKRAASGHLYFDLKDEQARIGCVMWKSDAVRLRARVEDGTEVLAGGRVSFYEKGGRCQVYVHTLEPRGLGAMEVRFRELKERLQREGLFAAERKQPLPAYPRTIGLVTSETGAAIRDILHVLRRRWPALHVLLYPVRVQGDGASDEIARAVRDFDRHLAERVDVLIVGRGGGSAEDLWAFNEECVARAITECRIPVVSAVGHETDFSISDFVADVRAPTPSAAAETAVPDRRDLLRRVGTEARRLQRALDAAFQAARHRWVLARNHRFFKYPEEIAGDRAAEIDDLASRLTAVAGEATARRKRHLHELERRFLRRRPGVQWAQQRGRLAVLATRHEAAGRGAIGRLATRLEQAGHRLHALSPTAVLERGYSITLSAETGRAVTRADQVSHGDWLETILARRERIRSKVAKQKQRE